MDLILPVQIDRIDCVHSAFAAFQHRLLLFDQRLLGIQFLLLLPQSLQPENAFVCTLRQRQFFIILLKIRLQSIQFLLFLGKMLLIESDQVLHDSQKLIQVPGTSGTFCPGFRGLICFIRLSLRTGQDTAKKLQDADLRIFPPAKAGVHPVLEPVLNGFIPVRHKDRPEYLGSLICSGIEQFPELTLCDHRNLLELLVIDMQKFLHRTIDFRQSFNRILSLLIQDGFLIFLDNPAAPEFFSLIRRLPPDMVLPSLM